MGRGKIRVFGCNKMCASISVVLVVGIVTTCVIGFLAKRAYSCSGANFTLCQHIVHRHGERAPLKSYPLDPYKGESFWPEGLAALLQILLVTKRCDLLTKEEKQWKTLIQKQLDGHDDLLTYLSKSTGLEEVKTLADISSIYNNLEVVEEQGLLMPQWAQNVDLEELKSFAEIESMQLFKTPTMMKLQTGVLINEIVTNMMRKMEGSENFSRLLSLYSASDRVLSRLWRGLNITREISRQHYGAALITELHEINDRYRVRILHKRGSFEDELSILTIQGCEEGSFSELDEMCDLDTFSSVLQPIMITDFDEACQNPQ
nr:PREDICTED: lysosomal acid phosphatase-like isoform X2 [Bemisia tabaci]